MHDRILATLDEIERERKVRILFACESGSRAWGFASPDSDYDVRFVYAHDVAWHLRLGKRRDTIQAMLPDDLDLSGWELGKALRLFAGCNLSLYEWLGSPLIYREKPVFTSALRPLIPSYFNPKKAVHHYLGIARGAAESLHEDGTIGIKKFFYLLRPLMACRWITEKRTMPPTLFVDMLSEEGLLPAHLSEAVEAIRKKKRTAPEGFRISLPDRLSSWIQETRAGLENDAEELEPGSKAGLEPLEAILMEWTLNPPE
ncbi:MAG: nucleotidyltransferase domain-containing protein [Acidobacteriota bacterium]|nr:nucleotidyltransferase domain-containing protein [Acidobacteriota bacterium]